jgi:hypothetical protein
MDVEKREKFNHALQIIRDHYKATVEELADEIIEHEEQFQMSGYGKAQTILEKYSKRICDISRAWQDLDYNQKQTRHNIEMSNKDVHLKQDEFLCFRCRNIIQPKDEKCSECGWTWVFRAT